MGQTSIDNVFLSCNTHHCGPAPFNFSIYKILQKFQTPSGKRLSSRALRTSKITESRKRKMSEEDKVALAEAMNHTLATAERNYNYCRPSDSVVKVLSKSKSTSFSEEDTGMNLTLPLLSSTPVKRPRIDRKSAPLIVSISKCI